MKLQSINKLILLIFFSSLFYSCSQNIDEIKECKNKAIISIEKNGNDNNQEKLNIPEKIELDLKEIIQTSGSITSLQLGYFQSEDNYDYDLQLILPAGEKFEQKGKEGGGTEFITDELPSTIKKEDYKAFPNALDDTPNQAKALFQIFNKQDSSSVFLSFTLDSLIIYQIQEIENEIQLDMVFFGKSDENTSHFHGKHNCKIAFCAKKDEIQMMMVD
jgi:hypothetical protein